MSPGGSGSGATSRRSCKPQRRGVCTPRVTQDLPLRCHRLSPAECFRTFVKAVFYVGKGTRARPYCHLSEALSQHRAGTRKVGCVGDCAGGLEAAVVGTGPW